MTADWRTNETDESDERADASSTDTTNQRTVAASAVIVGSSASIEKRTDATAGDDQSSAASTAEAEAESNSSQLVLIPMTEYRPGLTLRVVERLPAPIAVQLLRLPNDETVPVLERPDEYTGYVARAEVEEDLVRSTTVIFTRESLESGACYTFEADAQVFSSPLHLFRATARRVEC